MRMRLSYFFPLLFMLLCSAVVVIAQDAPDDTVEMTRTMLQAPGDVGTIISGIMFGSVYLIIYATALIVALHVFRLFPGFDGGMYQWVGLLWIGGMAVATGTHVYCGSPASAVFASMPLVFLWSVIMMRMRDYLWDDSAKVSAIVMIACAAYVTPPWVNMLKVALHR